MADLTEHDGVTMHSEEKGEKGEGKREGEEEGEEEMR